MAIRKFKDLTGQSFDLLTATERIKIGTKHRWVCVCKCGAEVRVNAEALIAGQRKSCGCLRTTGYLIGNTYGKLTVVSYASRDRGGRIMVNCACVCGGSKTTAARNLSRGVGLHCGCSKPPAKRLPEATRMVRQVMASYRSNAKRKGNAFTLSELEFTALVTSNCYYCNTPPSNRLSLRGQFLSWSGVDRKNNSEGYVPSNVVPCCTDCNYMKCERDHDEFLTRVKAINENVNNRLTVVS